MVHPCKPDYNNPIHAIFNNKDYCAFKFETKDGSVSEHLDSKYQFERYGISPKDTQITKIQVWSGGYNICGFKLYSDNDVVLETGFFDGEMKEEQLEAGERLVAVKSRLWDNTPFNNTFHCNLVLVIGKLA